VRVALAATLIKRSADFALFATVFDRCFPAAAPDAPGDLPRDLPTSAPDLAPGDQLAAGLAAGDAGQLDALARRLVGRYGGFGSVSASERYHQQRVERAIDLSRAFQTALRASRPEGERRPVLDEALARAEIEGRLQQFRRQLREEVRRRMGDEAVAPSLSASVSESESASVEDTDFLGASTTELRAMRQAVRPLARRLAARLASRDRRQDRGRVDVRGTIHRSLGSGGVPVDLNHRRRRRSRPDLWLLCDVSGSVADFARFMLSFLYAMHEEFPRIRTFLFVDDVEEVTDLLAARAHDVDPFALPRGLLARATNAGRRRSDYGRALELFWSRYGHEVGPRATVVISGDARTHDRDPRGDVLAAVAGRARRVWFLNPEPRAAWDLGDSVASLYGGICHHMAEVRNLRQLAACVAELA
jgi:hypothetical protein